MVLNFVNKRQSHNESTYFTAINVWIIHFLQSLSYKYTGYQFTSLHNVSNKL